MLKRGGKRDATTSWPWRLALLPFFFLIACSSNESGSGQINLAPNDAKFRGPHVYQKFCAPCHDATDLHLIKDPPPLDGLFRRRAGLFRKKTFPSGAPATDDELREVILHGRGTMPAFEGTLNADDVNALVQYMHAR
jgi:mono/diheme cytochrome c family protein